MHLLTPHPTHNHHRGVSVLDTVIAHYLEPWAHTLGANEASPEHDLDAGDDGDASTVMYLLHLVMQPLQALVSTQLGAPMPASTLDNNSRCALDVLRRGEHLRSFVRVRAPTAWGACASRVDSEAAQVHSVAVSVCLCAWPALTPALYRFNPIHRCHPWLKHPNQRQL